MRRLERLPQTAASILALLLMVFGVLVIFQADANYQRERADRSLIRARILAASVTAAVDFRDVQAVNEAASAFKVDPGARIAAVYDSTGKLLSGFARRGSAVPAILPLPTATRTGTTAYAPVMRGSQRIGTIFLSNDTESWSRRAARYALITVLVFAGSLIVLIMGLAQRSLRGINRQLQDSNGDLVRAINEREVAEAQLRQVQKIESIGQLTGGIAHDFNNMLAIVIGGLDMAERRFETDRPRARTALGHAREGAERAADLTRRLLAFARQQPLQPQMVLVNKLVSAMSELLRRTLGEGIEIEAVLAGGLWSANVDSGQLENAVLNLCVNARDAMDGRGRLTIETQNAHLDDAYAVTRDSVMPGQYVVVAISDTGPGMSREVIDRAFEPFFTTKGVGKGTGLGLAQVHGFTKQSGGHVEIYSEIGQGTTVKLYLPRFSGVGTVPRPEIVHHEVPNGHSHEVILVLEDEEQVRRMSVDNLRDLGYSVIETSRGAEAIEMLIANPDISLLFTDVVMPEMNGREVADRAREIRPDLPVLFTTGYTRNAIIHNGVVDRGVDLISKPYTIEELARKVRAMLTEMVA